ncbi:hypothetical protein HMF7854_05365 [Sphingomonas ginkgonis]|uniref:Uncharacterized protein n=1 Tax=Sphingomonas ginkgonis TaxID=2315330 RepID=A0A429VDX1_9SPHN|nr:hypothetical protein HMF7854_05365 [Sphingomonas ginkgonis]
MQLPQTYDRASDVVADGDRVLVDGPDHVHVALTASAAAETGERLARAAMKATQSSLAANENAAE